MLAFLCGGMEYSPDGGRQWRERMRLWVQETLNHRVYDPAEEARRLEWVSQSRCEWDICEASAQSSAHTTTLLRDLDRPTSNSKAESITICGCQPVDSK